MRIILNFGPSKTVFRNSFQSECLRGVIHKILGKNNTEHDTFSTYSVSTLRGGKMVKGGISYPKGGFVYVSSPDPIFLDKFWSNLISLLRTSEKIELHDMELLNVAIENIQVNKSYDIIHVESLLLKNDNKWITFEDEEFIPILNKKSLAKLQGKGIGLTDDDLKGFNIKPFHFENAKIERPKIRNVVNPSSKVMLVVEGTEIARKTLYELGLGQSTGSSYGAVIKVRG